MHFFQYNQYLSVTKFMFVAQLNLKSFMLTDPKSVKGDAPMFHTKLLNITAKEGQKVVYEVKVSGDPQPSITWQKHGILLPNCNDFAQVGVCVRNVMSLSMHIEFQTSSNYYWYVDIHIYI